MQFHAILSNPDHPEYGVATIPFPLPMKEYDHSIEVLSALEIGDAVRQDCKVEEITDCYSVLKRLERQSAVDELDYLAKRLDSFRVGEDAQFQAMAENLELFEFIPKVKTPAEYGRYMIEESGHFEYDPNLDDFYDFEGYARQRMRQEQGQFVEGGYISYQGFQSLDEVMVGSPTLDEGFQMGGML